MKLNFNRISAFSTIIIFVVIGLVGIYLINFISIRLNPQQDKQILNVNYFWDSQNPRIIESEVTSKIELTLSKLEDLTSVISRTDKGYGNIRLTFADNVNINKSYLQTSALLRQVYQSLPEGVSFPNLQREGIIDNDNENLMSLSVSGNKSKDDLLEYAKNTIRPHLLQIPEINDVTINGLSDYYYLIICDNHTIEKYNIELDDLKNTISLYFENKSAGIVEFKDNSSSAIKIEFKQLDDNILQLLETSILNKDDIKLRLKDIISITKHQNKPLSYTRYNGNDALTINVATASKANQLHVSKEVLKKIDYLNQIIDNDEIKTSIIYDSSIKLKIEFKNVVSRVLFSLIILLLFVFVIKRRIKYVYIVIIGLVSNILFAIIFYTFFSIDIHLYSLAGLTISLGIIIDNIIIMLDDLAQDNYKKKGFISILAATFTTIGSLSMIFFIQKEYQLFLIDFCWIIIINLVTSLAVTFFLIPSLSQKIKLKRYKNSFKKRRKIIFYSYYYQKLIEILISKNKIVVIISILLFGLPLFLLPEKIAKDSEAFDIIEDYFSVSYYENYIYPSFKYLGGTLYPFIKKTEKSTIIQTPKRLSLKIRLYNIEGGTLEQLDEVVRKFEKKLITYSEVDYFITEVESSNQGFLKVFLYENLESGELPYLLKNKLEAIASEIGGINCSIYGVGSPYSNSGDMVSDATIKLTGYNLDELERYSLEIKDSVLLKHPRVTNVKINSEKSWILKENYEFKMALKNHNNVIREFNNNELISNIKWNAGSKVYLSTIENTDVFIAQSDSFFSKFELENSLIYLDSTSINVGQVAEIQKTNVNSSIVKKNGNYELYLDYSFLGNISLNNSVYKDLLIEINRKLPLGFQALHPDEAFVNNGGSSSFLKFTLIIILIIYFICSILFESLTLPFAIILTIPTSFIGVFLTFSIFDLPFDQGGLASFIMLSGIVVNSSIYIINQYINISDKGRSDITRYIKAFNMKITPISLTIISTVLGLLPFVFVGKDEFFWTSFAYGNIGGLLFSFLIILFVLPVFLNLKNSKR